MAQRIFLVFIALHFISLSANAQASFLFPQDTSAIFLDHNQSEYYVAYIDSTSNDDLGTHYHFKGDFNQNWTNVLCWDSYCDAGNTTPCGFGASYTAASDTTHRFVNSLGDTLNFNFNLEVGQSSMFFNNGLHYFITRLYNSTSDLFVPGELVMNYEITVMLDYQETTTPFSGQVISIGEYTGLHAFFDIQGFPYEYNRLALVGNTELEAGVHPFTYTEAFDHQLAEVYQYQKSSSSPGSSSSTINTYTIMSRANGEESVTYQIQKESITTVFSSDYEYIIPPEIIIAAPYMMEMTYYDEEIAPHLYGPRYASQGAAGYGQFDTTQEYGDTLLQLTIGVDAGYYSCDDDADCFFATGIPDYRYKKYVPGLGKVYEHYGLNNYGWTETLIYFEKDGVTWGEDATSVGENIFGTTNLSAYPNPSSGIVTLSIPVQNAELYNAMGQLQTYVNGSTVDLTRFAEGLYLLKTSRNDRSGLRIIKQ